MKTFLVCYEIREINDKSFDDFHNYLKNVSSKYFHVLNSATLIQTDTEIDEIQKTLYEITTRPGNKMFYFVLEIPTERSKVRGWIFNSFWDWFQN